MPIVITFALAALVLMLYRLANAVWGPPRSAHASPLVSPSEQEDRDRNMTLLFLAPSYVALLCLGTLLATGTTPVGEIATFIHARSSVVRALMWWGILFGYGGAPASWVMICRSTQLRSHVVINLLAVGAVLAQIGFVWFLVLLLAAAPFGAAW